jgi:Fe2+ transport system protein B
MTEKINLAKKLLTRAFGVFILTFVVVLLFEISFSDVEVVSSDGVVQNFIQRGETTIKSNWYGMTLRIFIITALLLGALFYLQMRSAY